MSELNKNQIFEKYQVVKSEIKETALFTGRNPDDIKLVVVTKGHSINAVRDSVEVGIRVFGENYVQEAIEKIEALSKFGDIEWHMIGHIQSRKAKEVAEHFDWVQSLDRLKVARRLDISLSSFDQTLPVLLEFNVSGEASKYGIPAWEEEKWGELIPEIQAFEKLGGLDIRGLMTMPPFFDDPEKSRSYFQKLCHLQEFLRNKLPQFCWDELSMGMSADYKVAVEEGATIVRVGTAIMGPRSDSKR